MAIAVLGGCSRGETANETLPEAPPSATETSEALPPLGPPDLPMPPEAREQTEAGAAAFVRYYMDVYNNAQSSMDPTYLDQFSQDCETCNRIAAEISSDASLGYAYRGGQVSVDYIDTTEPEDMTVEAVFSMTQAPLTVVDATGQPVADLTFGERSSPGSGAILAWSQTDQTWVLNQWDVA
ncbi:DUF6318 family protein [Modestobacter sp. VKM Ac-2979]|uniref:DUF6318 family protein n=1 Tax=unclassified Modestobacter TaxID=2643866 RepID=UPI0022AB9830|nr:MULTISPECIES: DUF6318 family protein [unclassified Modestobacter]MCZ2813453.1 DUF6318 family protein [Modestobacter sp. VKM Ac-2979]MCZ2842355.1 DUF6318 family protein [Modestobacter sp. VKM Ac-2980]